MKKLAFLSLMLIALIVGSCKKDDNTPAVYMPRLIDGYTNNCLIYDPRDLQNVKRYDYSWNNVQNKFVYYETIDTTAYKELKTWPAAVTDPVGAGYSTHFLDRSNGSTTYHISYGNPTITGTLAADYPGFTSSWIAANKIDGYAIFWELYDAGNDYSRLYFDFASAKYLFAHGASGTYSEGNITDLVKTPNGNVATDPIDWTKADAAFTFQDPRYPDANAIIFIDYDEMAYVELTRADDLAGGDSGRHNLRTTAWHPLTELFDTWKF